MTLAAIVMIAMVVLLTWTEASCVNVYIIDDKIGTIQVDYGTYLYRNRSQASGDYYITPQADQWVVQQHYFCTVIHSIITDDPIYLRKQIEQWVEFECDRVELERCVVKDMTGTFNQWTLLKTDQTSKHEVLTTPSPTIPMTAAPTLSVECDGRETFDECLSPLSRTKCEWFGVTIRCKPFDWCGFSTPTGCLSRWRFCRWNSHRCQPK